MKHALIVLVLASAALTVSPAQAQDDGAAETRAPSPWQVSCNDRGDGMQCQAVQRIVLRNTRRQLLAVTVRKADAESAMSMLIHLPHGLFLPAGLSYDIDGASETTLEIQTCNRQGCYAGAALEADRLEALQQGGQLTVRFQNLDKKTVSVPVSLKGFTAAVEKL